MGRLSLLLLATLTSLWPQGPAPRFEDYPAAEIYRGPVASPRIVTAAQRSYRTQIREGGSRGWGSGGPTPNFAGNMVIVQWMCGAPCTMMAMVNGRSGVVYGTPFAMAREELRLPLLQIGKEAAIPVELRFRLDSRLLIVDATVGRESDRGSYTHYFLWEGDRWKLLRRVALERDK